MVPDNSDRYCRVTKFEMVGVVGGDGFCWRGWMSLYREARAWSVDVLPLVVGIMVFLRGVFLCIENTGRKYNARYPIHLSSV